MRKTSTFKSKYEITDFNLLNACLESAALCRSWKNPKGKLFIRRHQSASYGLANKFEIACSTCNFIANFFSSERLSSSTKKFDINIRSVYASQTIGHTGLSEFCSTMGLSQPVNKNSYQEISSEICTHSTNLANQLTKESAKKLIQQQYGENITGKIANVKVSVDGSWQRRGHCSKIGVVFIISIDTGEVLDFEVKNLYCHQCSVNKNNNAKENFDKWYEGHKNNCTVNHQGSSGAMETEATFEMFLRSIDKNNLRYTTYVGDGDSSSFAYVREKCLSRFGESYTVTKEECLGHVQKRMGKALIELTNKMRGRKLDDEKALGGRGRLTKKLIDTIQNNYGYAIRNNVGNIDTMYNAIWAVFYHSICQPSMKLDEQHDLCPRQGWCNYWTNKQNYTESRRLRVVFADLLKPIFTRLSNRTLLSRCQGGYTQNQNESINNVLWTRCLKTKFCGYNKVYLAVCDSVSYFNAGATSKSLL